MPNATNPGIHPQLNGVKFSDREWRIINKLSKEWYVTTGGEVKLGPTSEYRYVLIKPTHIYEEMFNLEREIVTIFSAYESFEPRTLDAIDGVVKRHQALRLERVCSVVVSEDFNVEAKLRNLLKNDQESQTVVPFTYGELISKDDPFFIRNRFKEHFYHRDLFAFEAPLKKDLYFFGMNEVVNSIVNRHISKENSALFGLRKTGKTSVIYGIERTLEKIDVACVVIDCQDTAFHGRRWNQALFYIIAELRSKYKCKLESSEASYTEINASITFRRDITRIREQINRNNILIIFDEIENITFHVSPSEHWKTGTDFVFFWQTLRSIFQKQNDIFTYLLVGTNAMCVEKPTIQDLDNPIFNQTPFNYIPKFDVKQTKEMVSTLGSNMGLQFDEIIFSKLAEDFGGHPFLIRHVCSVMHKMCPSVRPARVGKPIYEKAKEQFYSESSNYIEMILTVLSQFYYDEFQMLGWLATGDIKAFREFADLSSAYTNHLLGYGIIEQQDGDYCFRIEAVRDYLQKRLRYQKLSQTPAERLSEVSERRNTFEAKLRRIVRSQLLANHGKDEAKNMLLIALGPDRAAKCHDKDYGMLFDGKSVPLYFEDLRKLIIKDWVIFKHIFSKGQEDFDRKMKTINLYRYDAHAKEMSNEEMNDFRSSMTILEQQIEDF